MTDNLKPEDRQKTMRAVKSKGTKIERRLYSMLALMGLSGWKKHADKIVGKPDALFEKERVAIFIDGCFWHGCPYCRRKLPVTNRKYWRRKIERNIILAQFSNRKLRRDGWSVIRFWEHDLERSNGAARVRQKIYRALAR